MPKRHPELNDPDWLRTRYIDQQRTLREIGQELGVTDGAVFQSLWRNGIATRTAASSRKLRGTDTKGPQFPQLGDRAWLEQRYTSDGQSLADIAKELGCTSSTVGNAMRRFGMSTRTADETNTMRLHPLLTDHGWLRVEYVDNGRSTPEIAAELGCTPQAVQHQLHRAGVKMRGRHYGRWNPKQCERCSTMFTPSGPAARFCSTACQQSQSATCEQCGVVFTYSGSQLRRFCSRACLNTWKAEHWKPILTTEGYLLVPRPPSQTRALSGHGYVLVNTGRRPDGSARPDGRILEHRLVMEQMLGRPLTPTETVHHINNVKTDNRPENLQLRNGRHGRGAHFICGDCGSANIVAAPL